MKKKNITINELAGMVKTGFDEMGKQFEKVDKRFVQADKRFENIENRLTAVEQRLDNIDLRLGQFAFKIDFQELKRKVEMIEKKCCATR